MDLVWQISDWIEAFHIISVMFRMAGMYYLPRLFVYHAEAIEAGQDHSVFEKMDANLLRIIMNPAMILSWIFGLLLLHSIGLSTLGEFWLIIKFVLVISLTFYHFYLFSCLRRFNENNNNHSPRFFRIINEVPTVLLIAIIFIVVFKPI